MLFATTCNIGHYNNLNLYNLFVRFMMTNKNIVSLDLSFNVIRADGAEFIAEVCCRFTFNILRNVTT